MNRIVLVSDVTKEFPKNTTSSSKVRLPVPLELKGEGWKVGFCGHFDAGRRVGLGETYECCQP